MKKWTGGVLIVGLAFILLVSYSFIQKQPHKQSPYEFFHPNQETISLNGPNHTTPQRLQTFTKIPHLVNPDGLEYLFNLTYPLHEEALLTWGQMRLLLSRSDSLPETAQGIKEAAAAWKTLRAKIDEKRARGPVEERNCTYSVHATNVTKFSSDGSILLGIPCGLIEDSSVTIIGVPDGPQEGFEIEFVGSEEPDRPVVLHYNVVLPGDNFTKEPVIVQNTWTREAGWGEEERCPNHASSNREKVDGLVKCNEQLTRSSLEENSNAKDRGLDKLTNGTETGAHNHIGSIFPFSDGSPFTATVWAGAEGFHATVNGRHETSFAYREKLEPWSVGGVRAKGGLRIVSALAKGLPVSEDLDVVMDLDRLRAPPLSEKSKRLVLLIGVFSSGNNFERRMALRRSWMQYEAVRSGAVAVRFFIGLHKNPQVNFELWREAEAYGDVQLMPFVDYYSLLTLKTIAICIMGTKILPAKYVMKTDDDAFVRVDEILASLKTKTSNGLLYGLVSLESTPQRDTQNKWYISPEEWPYDSYPPWAHGPGYVVSRDIAKFIVRGHQERSLKLFKLEDVAVGIWIEQFQKHGHEVRYVNDERFYNAGCEGNYILAHYQNPRMVLCLWEKLRKEHKPDCCD